MLDYFFVTAIHFIWKHISTAVSLNRAMCVITRGLRDSVCKIRQFQSCFGLDNHAELIRKDGSVIQDYNSRFRSTHIMTGSTQTICVLSSFIALWYWLMPPTFSRLHTWCGENHTTVALISGNQHWWIRVNDSHESTTQQCKHVEYFGPQR